MFDIYIIRILSHIDGSTKCRGTCRLLKKYPHLYFYVDMSDARFRWLPSENAIIDASIHKNIDN